jgi:hypothetical protein
MVENPKICMDCRWCSFSYAFSTCSHPSVVRRDLVTGVKDEPLCSRLRTFGGECGNKAKLFELRTTLKAPVKKGLLDDFKSLILGIWGKR